MRGSAATWPRQLVDVVLSFEMLFALYLFAGRFKAAPMFAWIPIDITGLLFAASCIAGVWVLWRRRFVVPADGCRLAAVALGLSCWCALSYIWSPGTSYALEKLLGVAVLQLWALVGAAMVVASDELRVRRFFVIVVLLAIWITLETYLAWRAALSGESLIVLGGNYLGVGIVAGIGIICLMVRAGEPDVSALGRVGCLAIASGLFAAMLATGGRGPLICMILALLVPWLVDVRVQWGKLRMHRYTLVSLLAITAGVAVLALLIQAGHSLRAMERFVVLMMEAGGGESASNRVIWMQSALPIWSTAVVAGHGLGSWPIEAGYGDVRLFPHNVLLETLVETGVIGAMLLVGLYVVALYGLRARHVRESSTIRMVLLVLLMTTLHSMISGHLPEERALFCALGLLAVRRSIVDKGSSYYVRARTP